MSENTSPSNIARDADGNPLYRRLRPWGKYAFVSSILLVISAIICAVVFFTTFSFAGTSPVASLFFYTALGFGISSIVFAAMAFGAGRDKLYAGLSFLGPVFLAGCVVLLRIVFAAG